MKNFFISIIILYTLNSICGCVQQQQENKEKQIDPYNNYKSEKVVDNNPKFSIITIDSCEYIEYQLGTYSGILTHKGNCKHCRNNRNK